MGPGVGSLLTLDPARIGSWPEWSAAVAAVAGRGAGRGAVLGAVATAVAEAAGHRLPEIPLLGRDGAEGGDEVVDLPPLPADLAGPDLLGAVDQHLLDPVERRARGAHYTSPDLALALVAWALADWEPNGGGRLEALRVLDPAVGAGAFLLAAARWQVTRGADPAPVLAGLAGTDVDPVAVAAAEAALVLWALDQGVDVERHRPSLGLGDGLDGGPPEVVDLVVGNPPFLGQLQRATARDRDEAARRKARFGPAAGAYTDTAALFLVAGCEAVRPGGRLVLVQPESVLGTRDGRGARTAVAERADLVGLWVAGEAAFAAEVDVCAPVLEVRGPEGPGAVGERRVRRAWGTAVVERPPSAPPPPRSWASLLAAGRGVPEVDLDRDRRLGDLVAATAGFRQHYYGLVPHLRELPGGDPGPGLAPLATVGTVDPLRLLWGRRPTRVAGRSWLRPVVDLEALAAAEPEVARWVRARLRPKVLVAPQTRVVEAAVDRAGRAVPGVPLVAVEIRPDAGDGVPAPPSPGPGGPGGPSPEDDEEWLLWLAAAALSAPPVTAWAFYETAGTARHGDAVKLAARQVLAVPLPVDGPAWAAAAAALRVGTPLVEVGADLTRAYGLDADHPVTAWWAARLPPGQDGGATGAPAPSRS